MKAAPILLFAYIIFPLSLFAQMDFKKMGYNTQKVFIYEVAYSFKKAKDTIGLFCSDVMYPSPANPYHQQYSAVWAYMTKVRNNWQLREDYQTAYEGIAVADSFLFIHPPRGLKGLRSTQFYPYPFVKSTVFGWEWSFAIGPGWNSPPEFDVKGVDTFLVNYQTRKKKFRFKNKRITGWQTKGESQSEHGISYSKINICNQYGITLLEYRTTKNETITFTQIENTSNYDIWGLNYQLQKQKNDEFNKIIGQ